MEVVHVLRDQQQVAGPGALQPGQGQVRGVGLHGGEAAAPLVVETVDQGRIAAEGLWGGHVLHPVVLPEAVGGAEGPQAALGGDARAGEDDDGGGGREGDGGSGQFKKASKPPDYHQDAKAPREAGVWAIPGVLCLDGELLTPSYRPVS